MKQVCALVLIATFAVAQNRDPCKEGYCKEQTFHVTDVETKDILDTPDGDYCRLGFCSGTHYDVSGYVQEPGKNAILYRAWCNDITWTAGQNKGQHNECVTVEAGQSYRARIFPTNIDFSIGKNFWQYTSVRSVKQMENEVRHFVGMFNASSGLVKGCHLASPHTT